MMYPVLSIECDVCKRRISLDEPLYEKKEIEEALRKNGFHVFTRRIFFEPEDDDCVLHGICEKCLKEVEKHERRTETDFPGM